MHKPVCVTYKMCSSVSAVLSPQQCPAVARARLGNQLTHPPRHAHRLRGWTLTTLPRHCLRLQTREIFSWSKLKLRASFLPPHEVACGCASMARVLLNSPLAWSMERGAPPRQVQYKHSTSKLFNWQCTVSPPPDVSPTCGRTLCIQSPAAQIALASLR